MDILPKLPSDQALHISSPGLEYILNNVDPHNPDKNFLWTTDYKVELPVRVKKSGIGSQKPFTICQMWKEALPKFSSNIAINYEKGNSWVSLTYKDYYDNSTYFAAAMISLGITIKSTINIIGFNSCEWAFSFHGSIFGGYVPVGIYTTNNPQACQYIANHSECEVVVLEDRQQLNKYIQIVNKTPNIKYYVIYKEGVPNNLPLAMKGKVLSWQDVMNLGKDKLKLISQQLERRMEDQKPGQCCSFIYTSGTTGPPKAVMISHDNYTWISDAVGRKFHFTREDRYGKFRFLCMLPLSHVAAQLSDLVIPIRFGGNLFFAGPSALQGNLLKYLLVCKPHVFMTVPRVFEKIEEKITALGSQTAGLKRKLVDWAKEKSAEGTYAQQIGKEPSFGFKLAKKVLFNKIKQNLGLDQCQIFIYAAAPLRQSTRQFFLNLNIFLHGCFGMSQVSGPQTFTQPKNWQSFSNRNFQRETGMCLEGLEMVIDNPDSQGNGQICMRGRNRFMGYFKNQSETKSTIDTKGFVHSGDVGRLDEKGNLTITGRIKQLIITAGGENVAPVLIENQINTQLPLFNHVVVIGDKRKYLTALLTLKCDSDFKKLSEQAILYLKTRGSSAITVEDALKCGVVRKIINEGLNRVNEKVISKAQSVIKFAILPNQFSTETGQLTPTMKLKRKVINEKYQSVIQGLYIDSKL